MGTRKKLLLASLVSTAMVLAFVLGAMPGFDASRLAAGSDQVAMQDILDALLGGADKGIDLSVNSAVQAVVVKTPAGAEYEVPEIPLPLNLNASVGSVPVRYVANVEGDPSPWSTGGVSGGAGTWTGVEGAYTDPAVFASPYASTLDIGAFVTGEASVRTLLIYGLANATLASKQAATITYTSATPDPYAIDLREVDGDTTDTDGNGIPDDPFANVGDAEIWTALVDDGEGNLRNTLLVNLDTVTKGGTQVFASPENGITVTAPSTADLIAANAIGASESALLVVQVVDNLADLLDDAAVTGFADAAAWAEAALATVPVSARSVAGPIVDVSILVNDGLGNLSELDSLPGGLTVDITIEDLTVGEGEELSLLSTSTTLSEGTEGLELGNDGTPAWDVVEEGISTGTLSVGVSELSAFVPFLLPAVDITSATPNTALEGETVALTLNGVIPVAVGQSIAEAAAGYSVTVNGSPAEFRDGPGGFAISAYVNGATNAAYLYWTAAITTKATQQADIEISQIVDGSPVVVDSLSNAIEITPTYDVNVTAGTGGSVSIDTASNGPGGTYVEGSSVAISATADTGFEFVAWTGLEGAEANTASTTITVNGDRDLAATFQSTGGETFTLTLTRAGNGSGTVSPADPVTVAGGTVVAITANPSASSNFTGWTGDTATVADTTAASTTVTVNADITVTANFTQQTADDDELTVTGIDASGGLNDEGQVEVWLFGGETIRLNGTGLVAGADLVSFQVGSNDAVTADLFNTAPDGSFGLVVIPPTNATGSDAFFVANVTVTRSSDNATFDLGNIVRYRQYNTGDDDVTTTAFILDSPATASTVQVSTGEGNTNFASLTLPGLDAGTDTVYGLVRAGVVDASKGNTETVAGPVGTGQVNDGLAAAFGSTIPGFDASTTEIPGSVDFAFYLYGGPADDADKNTGTVGGAAFTPSNDLIEFGRGSSGASGDLPTPGDPEANQGNAGEFQIDLADGVLTHGDVRDGLTVWGTETQYDYVTDTLILVEDADVDYQSTVLNNEVSPVVIDAKQTADGTVVETVTMRLYTLNGFSLRQGVNASPEVTDGVRLNTQSGTATDDLAGGLPLTIVSPNGGLARIESARFVIGNATVGIVTEFTTAPGTDEYVLQLNAPASEQAGIASIVLTGRANNTAIQTVNLENVFEYTGAAPNNRGLLLLLLGLLAALIGLAAGGSSGGGGGGPCFIATAAYGTPLDHNIDVLRDVRDEFLLSNAAGTAFTDLYYQVAPTIADSVASSPALAAVVRMLLVPVIFFGKMALVSPALLALVALSIGFFYFAKRKGARQS